MMLLLPMQLHQTLQLHTCKQQRQQQARAVCSMLGPESCKRHAEDGAAGCAACAAASAVL
jgi:hypothetical protein